MVAGLWGLMCCGDKLERGMRWTHAMIGFLMCYGIPWLCIFHIGPHEHLDDFSVNNTL